MLTVLDLANRLNDGEQINAILLDFSKAVDKVPHYPGSSRQYLQYFLMLII